MSSKCKRKAYKLLTFRYTQKNTQMKKLLTIILLGMSATGCAVGFSKKQTALVPMIGMDENEFKKLNRKVDLIYLTNDTSVYELFKYSNDRFTTSDYYHFAKNKLYKFEQKTHYFNTTRVRVDDAKDKKAD